MSDATPYSPHESAQERPHILIIGGGISGLAAAYELERSEHAAGYTLVERDERLGGKILTERLGDSGEFVVEGGPDSFVAQKPWALELARELGLGEQIMPANRARTSTYVLLNGRPRPMPEGMMLIVPTRMLPFALSPILSPLGKLRMAMDLFIPARRDGQDETLAAFIRRRLGNEALERLAEPLMAGIHSAECERQSLLATFPRFRTMEEQHGSLIRGMLASRRAAARRPAAPSSPFMTLRGGVGALVEALERTLRGDIRRGRSVAALEPTPGAAHRYRARLDDGTTVDADAVVVTTPAYVAADLVQSIAPALADDLRAIRYVSTGTVTLAYRAADVKAPFDGFGMVIPRGEPARINAVTLSSRKFAHRAPEDHLLLRAFVGGSRNPAILEQDDETLLATVREDLRVYLGIDAEPRFSRIYRWIDANPQYEIGHLERARRIMAGGPEGLYIIGSAYEGVGIPDCIRQGRQAARQALEQTRETAPLAA